jgi:hypothetical protein
MAIPRVVQTRCLPDFLCAVFGREAILVKKGKLLQDLNDDLGPQSGESALHRAIETRYVLIRQVRKCGVQGCGVPHCEEMDPNRCGSYTGRF